MKRLGALRWLLVAGLALGSIGSAAQDSLSAGGKRNEQFLWPALGHGQAVVRHAAYALVYSEEHEQARWVAYELTEAETHGPEERSSGFYEDPDVPTGSATDADYAGSGFDRGHLAPAGDMTWSSTAMTESFYYSNMSPQQPSFNRGIWKKLETLARAWGQTYGAVFIITGPVLEAGLPVIGPNKVSVPAAYYKIILRYNGNDWHAIAFLLPNAASSDPLTTFVRPVDEIEKRTGLDFFPALPDDLENGLEAAVDQAKWDWTASWMNRTESMEARPAKENHSGESVQCSGITKAGSRCHNRTNSPSGRCHLHQ